MRTLLDSNRLESTNGREGTDAGTTRLWFDRREPDRTLLACAFVPYTGSRYGVPQLVFHIRPNARTPVLEDAVMAWVEALPPRAAMSLVARLDVHLQPGADHYRAALLERYGFRRIESVLHRFRRSLDVPVPEPVLPPGCHIRPLAGEHEIPAFVTLFHDVFGAGPTAQARAERWRRPDHVPELVVESPSGTLLAFCYVEVGSSTQMPLAPHEGCLAQLGTAKAHRGHGFGRAVLRAGLHLLHRRGLTAAVLQTGAPNEAAHRLYLSEGFRLAESLPRLRYTKAARGAGRVSPPAAGSW
jgi:GNAT superfamily N-acetyltransferase